MLDEALLYELTDSPYCLKARICLNLKRVAYRRVPVTLARARELRRLNPRGLVPVLVHGSETVPDSTEIVRYLERRFPAPSLYPEDPAARAFALLVEDWADEALGFLAGAFKWLNPTNRAAAIAHTVPEIATGAAQPLVAWMLQRRIRRRFAAQGYSAASLPHLEARFRDCLVMLADLLHERRCLLGRLPTIADVAAFAPLALLRRYAEADLVDQYAPVAAWYERLAAEPAIAAALPA